MIRVCFQRGVIIRDIFFYKGKEIIDPFIKIVLMTFLNMEFTKSLIHLTQLVRMRISNYVFILQCPAHCNYIRVEYWQL